MSTQSKWNPADLPGVGRQSKVVFQPTDGSSQMTPEYVSLEENEQQDAHASAGEVIVFCVLGDVSIQVDGQDHRLQPNELAHIGAGSLYKLTSNAASVILVLTMLLPHHEDSKLRTHVEDDDDVQEASEESFPASDSPSFNPGT